MVSTEELSSFLSKFTVYLQCCDDIYSSNLLKMSQQQQYNAVYVNAPGGCERFLNTFTCVYILVFADLDPILTCNLSKLQLVVSI